MGKSLAKAMASIPAIQMLIEKYGPRENWPTMLASWTPPPIACPRCQDRGQILQAETNPSGATVPVYRAVDCPDCDAGSAVGRARAERRWLDSGVSDEERARCTFAGFRLDRNPSMRGVRDAAQRWAAGDGPPFLVLVSTTRGLGKTHLAIAAAGACIGHGQHVCYAVVPRFLDRLRATYGQESTERLLAVRGVAESADALVFDDLGASKATEWANEQLFSVLDWRWSRSMRTLITSNVPPAEFEERIASRLSDRRSSLVLTCTGRDYRVEVEP